MNVTAEHRRRVADDPYQITEPLVLRPAKANSARRPLRLTSLADISATTGGGCWTRSPANACDQQKGVLSIISKGVTYQAGGTWSSGSDIDGHAVVGVEVSIRQTHAVSGTDISYNPAIDAGSITQSHVLISGSDMSCDAEFGVGTALEVGQATEPLRCGLATTECDIRRRRKQRSNRRHMLARLPIRSMMERRGPKWRYEFYLNQNDTGPSMAATLKDESAAAYDLTGATVLFNGASSLMERPSAKSVTGDR